MLCTDEFGSAVGLPVRQRSTSQQRLCPGAAVMYLYGVLQQGFRGIMWPVLWRRNSAKW